jgi:ankyrin repeat protein
MTIDNVITGAWLAAVLVTPAVDPQLSGLASGFERTVPSFSRNITAASNQTVLDAVKAGDRQALRSLLSRRSDVNATEVDGTSALHWAVRADDREMVALLVAAGADVNASNRYGITPLWLAATNASTPAVTLLLEWGADANAALLEGETVLMTAARVGSPEPLALLLDYGADPNARERGLGETALMWAAAQNHAAAVQLLVARGADRNARSTVLKFTRPRTPLTVLPRGGWTPSMFAARQGAMEAARMLAEAGADLNQRDPDGTTALVLAIINSHYDLAALLLEKGADPNVADERGMAALYATVDMHTLPSLFGSPEPKTNDPNESLGMAKTLLARGADPNARLKAPVLQRLHTPGDPVLAEGATPFMRAAKSGDVVVMRLLLEHGADPLAVQKNGTNALILASGLGWQDGGANLNTKDRGTQADAIAAITMCLERGLDIQAANDRGMTVVHAAVTRGEADEIIRFLVSRGARVDARNADGETPYEMALARKGQDGAAAVVPTTVNLLRELAAAPPGQVLR